MDLDENFNNDNRRAKNSLCGSYEKAIQFWTKCSICLRPVLHTLSTIEIAQFLQFPSHNTLYNTTIMYFGYF